MSESYEIKEMRISLYEEVWTEPMTTVAKKYSLSDNGLRKRCKALDIPLPPCGYWAKVKAGKPVMERPPLPPYDVTYLSNEDHLDDDKVQISTKKKTNRFLELKAIDEMALEQLKSMSDFDLLLPESLDLFTDWCNNIKVPGRVSDFHDLISKHKLELEYREARDKEQPFAHDGIKFWKAIEKVKYRDDEAVLPIYVSSNQCNRAYRSVDTILKAFDQLKSSISVKQIKKDNINILLMGTTISFELNEEKMKRRYLNDSKTLNSLRPIYEEVYNGKLQISWEIRKDGYYSSTEKEKPTYFNYTDSDGFSFESQIPTMIYQIYSTCCNNKILGEIKRKEMLIQLDQREIERNAKEFELMQQKLNDEKKAHKEFLINRIPDDADSWFKHEKLTKYADELEAYLKKCSDESTVKLLKEYIGLVRDNADKCNPICQIIEDMQSYTSKDVDS